MMPVNRRWPLLLGLIFFMVVLICVWSIRQASIFTSAVINRNYYQDGLHYSTENAGQWQISADLGKKYLLLNISNQDKKPLRHARVSIQLPQQVTLIGREATPGHYMVSRSLLPPRQSFGTVTVAQGKHRLVRSLLVSQ